jgi:hypothetical protein
MQGPDFLNYAKNNKYTKPAAINTPLRTKSTLNNVSIPLSLQLFNAFTNNKRQTNGNYHRNKTNCPVIIFYFFINLKFRC